jgi:hypothetical protein
MYYSSAGSGTLKFFNSQKILAIKNLKNCHLDFKYILKNSNNIDTLLLHNIGKNAQFYNIHKSALPFINKCIYLDTFNLCSQCTWGIFTFDQVVIDPKVKFMFRHLIKAKKIENNIFDLSNIELHKYLQFFNDFDIVNDGNYIIYELENIIHE